MVYGASGTVLNTQTALNTVFNPTCNSLALHNFIHTSWAYLHTLTTTLTLLSVNFNYNLCLVYFNSHASSVYRIIIFNICC